MGNQQMLPWQPPEALSDQTIAQLLELLYELARSLENHYAGQLHRYYQTHSPHQHDLWD